ncbi:MULTISPECIES: hypothetical protein [Comamonas]|uniref:hypothetical protein n=1 Tax=Comamonas TaxID=283 RepID=UPI0015F87970|nr:MULTISPECIES: hypothetical protein [Comamonas]UUC96477.1 hypothetical protein NOX35_27855 [Comamonas sp. C11]
MSKADQNDWDGKLSNIKVSKFSHPELYGDLVKVNQRDRGERLRTLAMLGLQSLNLSALVTGEPLAVPRTVEPEKNADADADAGSAVKNVHASEDTNQPPSNRTVERVTVNKSRRDALLGSM